MTSPVPAQGIGPAVELLGRLTWCSAGSTVHLEVTDPQQLRRAVRLAVRQLAAVERACLLPDSELRRVDRAGGRTTRVSPMLAELVAAALAVAERTGGDVDPVLAPTGPVSGGGRLTAIPTCAAFPPVRWRTGWRDVRLDGCRLTVPAGTRLDLHQVGTAVAADRAAAAVRTALGTGARATGVLVTVDGATATAGPAPAGGWDGPGLKVPAGAAVSTSWAGDGPQDGADGEPPVWRSATVLGFSAVEARAYGLAALARGTAAPRWLTSLGVTGRLVADDGRPVPTGEWGRRVSA